MNLVTFLWHWASGGSCGRMRAWQDTCCSWRAVRASRQAHSSVWTPNSCKRDGCRRLDLEEGPQAPDTRGRFSEMPRMNVTLTYVTCTSPPYTRPGQQGQEKWGRSTDLYYTLDRILCLPFSLPFSCPRQSLWCPRGHRKANNARQDNFCPLATAGVHAYTEWRKRMLKNIQQARQDDQLGPLSYLS